MPDIQVSFERKRGCGFRKGGGLYLVSGEPMKPCPRLPVPLDVCRCCGQGIKPARGWTWISTEILEAARPCQFDPVGGCGGCPMRRPALLGAQLGLLWVGERYYPTPGEFLKEALEMGVSRRIRVIPRDFQLGSTWVAFAHRKAIETGNGNRDLLGEEEKEHTAGIFQLFRPTRIEYIVKGDEPEDELDRLEKRGITLVKVVPVTTCERTAQKGDE
jgi:hypothetical protein